MRQQRKRPWMMLLSALALAACSDDDDKPGVLDAGGLPDAGGASVDASVPASSDGGVTPADAGGNTLPTLDCVTSPSTYLEILNACTDAEKVDKNPSLPLLLVDGGLPPLP